MKAEDEAEAEARKAHALCRTSAAEGIDFFPGRGESAKPAKDLCAMCPSKEACLEYALVNVEKFGIWGGMSERERRAIRSTRARQRPPASCGSLGGISRHWRDGTPACEPCREAHRRYRREKAS